MLIAQIMLSMWTGMGKFGMRLRRDVIAMFALFVSRPHKKKGGVKMINPILLIPGITTLLFTAFEMPRKVKKQFFKVPVWISSSGIALFVGVVTKGVGSPLMAFCTEIILFPGLALAKKHFERQERKRAKKKGGQDNEKR